MNTKSDIKYQWDFEISTSCRCRYCEDCNTVTEDETCIGCEKVTRDFGNCEGDCYDYLLEWIDELVETYSKNNGHDYLVIHGSRMGWRGTSGHTEPILATGENVLKALQFNGDWTIRFMLDENNLLTINRYSHDEPMGAHFYAVPSNGEEVSS